MSKDEERAIVRKYFCYFMLLWIAMAALYSQKADAAERCLNQAKSGLSSKGIDL